MRYAIPGNKAQQDRECVRLLRTITGQQARTLSSYDGSGAKRAG